MQQARKWIHYWEYGHPLWIIEDWCFETFTDVREKEFDSLDVHTIWMSVALLLLFSLSSMLRLDLQKETQKICETDIEI